MEPLSDLMPSDRKSSDDKRTNELLPTGPDSGQDRKMDSRRERRAAEARARAYAAQIPKSLRRREKWQPSQRVRNVLYAAPVGLLMALGLASIATAGVQGLPFAKALLIIAWVLSVISTLVAESFLTMSRLKKVAIFLLSLIVSTIICLYIWNFENDYYTEQITLEPGNQKTPNLLSMPDSESTGIIMGSNFDSISYYPFDFITIGDKKLFTIDNDGNKLIIKNLTLFDDRNDIIATVDNNVFWTRYDVHTIRPNKHTIIVKDHNNDIALKIDFINPQIIQIWGIFRNGNYPITITDSAIEFIRGSTRYHASFENDRFSDHQIIETDSYVLFFATRRGVSLFIKDAPTSEIKTLNPPHADAPSAPR